MGKSLKVTAAVEPTNIIWENRGFTDRERKTKGIMVLVASILLLLVAASLVVWMKRQQLKYSEKYPPVDCELLEEQYGQRLE